MASLILSEAVLDSTVTGELLDTLKAFGAVSHPVLKMLYIQGINSHLWQVVGSVYRGLSARVKWEGEISQTFCALQVFAKEESCLHIFTRLILLTVGGVLVLFLLFVSLCSLVVPALLSVFCCFFFLYVL